MTFYICYANEDRISAIRLNSALRALGYNTCFIDRGDAELLTDPMEDIMNGIKSSRAFALIHSEHTNASVLSQIEITYAKNLHLEMFVIKTGRGNISDSIRFELGSSAIINDTDMGSAAKKLAKAVGGK